MISPHILNTDPEIAKIIEQEIERQEDGLELIASENLPLKGQRNFLTPPMQMSSLIRDPRPIWPPL